MRYARNNPFRATRFLVPHLPSRSPMMRPIPTQERRVHGSAGSFGHCDRQGRIGGPVPDSVVMMSEPMDEIGQCLLYGDAGVHESGTGESGPARQAQ